MDIAQIRGAVERSCSDTYMAYAFREALGIAHPGERPKGRKARKKRGYMGYERRKRFEREFMTGRIGAMDRPS